MLIYYNKQKLITSFNEEEVRYMRIDRIKLITELAKQDLTQKHIAKALNVPIDRLLEK